MNEELAKRAVKDGHEVIFIVSGFKGSEKKEKRDGFTIIRVGNRFSVYLKTYLYYTKHLQNWPDLIIEEINTVPYFSQLYSAKPRILLFYQLCREIWFHEIFFPINILGYIAEPLYLRLLSYNPAITESLSAKEDLTKYGFHRNKISVIPPGITIKPLRSLNKAEKFRNFTVLSLGAMRSMKRTIDQIHAFEYLKHKVPDARMIIAGSSESTYGKKVLKKINVSRFCKDIDYRGFISTEEKIRLMRKAHVITVTSVKEGWGLIVTEANSQGTPAVVYDVDGLRDSVRRNNTGLITKSNTPKELANQIIKLYKNKKLYKTIQKNAYRWSMELNYDTSYSYFGKLLLKYIK